MPSFPIYAFVPSGVNATPKGLLNPLIVVVTVFVAVSITETVLA